MFMRKALYASALCCCLGLTSCSLLGLGLDLSICGTADWDAKSRGADTTTNRTVDVNFATNSEFKTAIDTIDEFELASARIEVASITADNKATKVSGRIEVGPADGSSRVLVGEYHDLAIAVGTKVDITLSDAGKKLAIEQLKADKHSFKAYIVGQMDATPAALHLRATFVVKAKVAGGGTAKDLGCVALTISSDEPAPTCDPNPCKNGGDCAVAGDVLACTCKGGFTGGQCETSPQTDLCAGVTCQNGGTCSAGTCQCVGGFTGDRCQTPAQVDLCAAVTCLNGGTCQAGTGVCQCTGGFTGPDCSIPVGVNACDPNPCQHGGACSAAGGTPTCACTPPYVGAFCETDMTMPGGCEANTCQNGGTCVPMPGAPMCNCPPGFSGAHCETSTSLCGRVPTTFECTPFTGPLPTTSTACTPEALSQYVADCWDRTTANAEACGAWAEQASPCATCLNAWVLPTGVLDQNSCFQLQAATLGEDAAKCQSAITCENTCVDVVCSPEVCNEVTADANGDTERDRCSSGAPTTCGALAVGSETVATTTASCLSRLPAATACRPTNEAQILTFFTGACRLGGEWPSQQ